MAFAKDKLQFVLTLLVVTTLGPVVLAAIQAAKFRFAVNLTAEKYQPALGDVNTLEFKILSHELEDTFTALFQDLEGNQTAIVDKFEKSGTGLSARLHLTSAGFTNQTEILKRLRHTLDTGYLGRFNTTASGFRLNTTTDAPRKRIKWNCPPGSYWCRDGSCIGMAFVCNGKPECPDKSDESDCVPKRVVVVVHPRALTVDVGARAQFFCGSTTMKNRMSWSKKGANLTKKANFIQRAGRLDIANVTEADAGEYTCTAERALAGSSATVKLTVNPHRAAAKHAEQETPAELSVSVVTAYLDVPAEIDCEVVGKNLTVEWSKIDGDLPKGATVRGITLYFQKLTFDDAGFYECRPTNGDYSEGAQSLAQLIVIPGPSNRIPLKTWSSESIWIQADTSIINPKAAPTYRLKPKKYPLINPSNLTVTEGEPFSFQCTSTRDPPAQLEWFRNDSRPMPPAFQSAGGNLTSLSVRMNDTGIYHCRHKGRKDEQIATFLTVLPLTDCVCDKGAVVRLPCILRKLCPGNCGNG